MDVGRNEFQGLWLAFGGFSIEVRYICMHFRLFNYGWIGFVWGLDPKTPKYVRRCCQCICSYSVSYNTIAFLIFPPFYGGELCERSYITENRWHCEGEGLDQGPFTIPTRVGAWTCTVHVTGRALYPPATVHHLFLDVKCLIELSSVSRSPQFVLSVMLSKCDLHEDMYGVVP